MRILVVTNMYPTPESPHAGVFVQRQVEALRRTLGELDIRVVHVDTVGSALRYATGRSVVRAALREYKPDVIHVHYGLTQLLLPSTDVPVVVTFHGSDLAIPWQRAVSQRLARRARALVVVSPEMTAPLSRLGLPVSIVPCGVDCRVFAPVDASASRARLGLPEDACLVAFPSSPERRVKGYSLFVQAVSLIPGATPVVLGGTLPGDMPEWLSAVDTVLYTSEREGSPVLSKEALCCGTRVVGVAVGDLPAQIYGLSGCRISASRDPQTLAAAVRDALAEPGPSPTESAARFSVEVEAAALLGIYRGALK
jgi:teichuronic acid biosynthesis glycosyltransferase TuaC